MAAQIIVPGVATYHTYKRATSTEGAAQGDAVEKQYYSRISAEEARNIAIFAALDVFSILVPAGRAATAARAARGLSATARMKAAGKAFGEAAASEVVAPVTMLRHPSKQFII